MNYMSVKQAAEKWGMTPRRVQVLCNEQRIDGAQRVGNVWTIPETAAKPEDARKKNDCGAKKVNGEILIERAWAMPNKNTFDIKPIAQLLEEEMDDGLWIDPFAGPRRMATVTNSQNPALDADEHLDALDFLKRFEDASVDGVLYQPPRSPQQAGEYLREASAAGDAIAGDATAGDAAAGSFWAKQKREIARIVKVGGKVITFSWNSNGIGQKYGFEISRILLVPHGGWHNDTLCTVEIKTREPACPPVDGAPRTDSPEEAESVCADRDRRLIEKLEALPEGYWSFKNDDTKEYTHGLHNYPAMMVCPISRNILRIVKEIMPVNALLDPFAGSGTVLVEGMLAGVSRIAGNDINPLALFLSQVKTTLIDMDQLQEACAALLAAIARNAEEKRAFFAGADAYVTQTLSLDLTAKDGWGTDAPEILRRYCAECGVSAALPDFKNIGYWFRPQVILALQAIKEAIASIADETIRRFCLVAFSETIRFVSNRRNGEFKMFRMPPDKVARFKPDVFSEFQRILSRNVEKMNAFSEACGEMDVRSQVRIFRDDAASLANLPDDSYDLVITSPPYGDSRTTVAYGEYSRLSLQWLGIGSMTEKEIMGLDRSLMGGKAYRDFENTLPSETLRAALEQIRAADAKRAGEVFSFYADLDKAIGAVAQKTKAGGYQFWVVGNRTVKNVLLRTDAIISELARAHGLAPIFTAGREIPNKVMPSLNSPSNEAGKKAATMTNEHIVVLRKAGTLKQAGA